MEVSGTVLRQVIYISGAGTLTQSFSRRSDSGGSLAGGGSSVRFHGTGSRGIGVYASLRVLSGGTDSGFCDKGHLQYYRAAPPRCGGKDKQKGPAVLTSKKKLKLLKGLSKGLSMISELDPEKRTLLDEVQGKLTLDAAEILLKQLEQLRVEERELKRKKKQEKAKLKASRMGTRPDCESSSSESSDSDCGEVVDMNSLRTGVTQADVDQLQPPAEEAIMLSQPSTLSEVRITIENPCEDGNADHNAIELCSRNDTNLSSSSVTIKDESSVGTTAPQKRIEVCMGNKCKKSGGPALLQEFERVMGAEAAVVGCKCMGKCRSGPNVRIKNSVVDSLAEAVNDSVKVPANPLFIGVGLEDVDAIVASFFGENQKDLGLATAATQ